MTKADLRALAIQATHQHYNNGKRTERCPTGAKALKLSDRQWFDQIRAERVVPHGDRHVNHPDTFYGVEKGGRVASARAPRQGGVEFSRAV